MDALDELRPSRKAARRCARQADRDLARRTQRGCAERADLADRSRADEDVGMSERSAITYTVGSRARRWIQGELEVLLTAEETGGGLGLWRFRSAAGGAAPLHVHANEEEQWTVISGRIAFLAGEERTELGPGDAITIPRGVPHAYLVLEDADGVGAVTPGGFETFFLSVGKPVDGTDEPNMAELAAGSKAVNVTVLGPPPIDVLKGL